VFNLRVTVHHPANVYFKSFGTTGMTVSTTSEKMQFWPTVLYICCVATSQHTANKVSIKYKGKSYTNLKKCKKKN